MGTAVARPSRCLGSFDRRRNRAASVPEPILRPGAGEGGSYGDLLDSDQLQRIDLTVIAFKAELDHFANPLHKSVKIFGLSMAAPQGGDGSHVVAPFILFNQDGELALGFHAVSLPLSLARRMFVQECRKT